MNAVTFANGIDALRDIFPRFKLSAAQQSAWYRRVEHFSDHAMLRAVDWLCEQEDQPTLSRLKSALRANELEGDVQWDKIEIQGMAPKSPESHALHVDCLRKLRNALGEKNRETRGNLLTEVKNLWRSQFRRLPGYVPPDGVKLLVERKDLDYLKKLGVSEMTARKSYFTRDDVKARPDGSIWVHKQKTLKQLRPAQHSSTVEYDGNSVIPVDDYWEVE